MPSQFFAYPLIGEIDASHFTLVGVLFTIVELVGIATAVHAVMSVRTSQGAIAWAISLVAMPYFALPLYWVFGRNKFQGYIRARRDDTSAMRDVVVEVATNAVEQRLLRRTKHAQDRVLEELAHMPFTKHNQVQLLVDGEETFGAIFKGLDAAQEYIVVQFFIIHDDQLGRELKQRLIEKARAGVRIYFLYDEVGCHSLSNKYIRELREAGVEMRSFHTTKGDVWNRFQLNFRNHRKIVIVDGRRAYVGGLNVGDEYMGRSEKFGPWRDTHVEIQGPAVHATQLAFLEDWYWATGEIPNLDWKPRPAEDASQDVLVLPSGPADHVETCGMLFTHLINSARRRLWIASPYFVPEPHVVIALQLAAMRGVDVRIMLPHKPDHLLVYLSGFTFLEETEAAGVKTYRYQAGFLHQKVILVDDELAGVGTANLDNRSFRLNFEITILVDDWTFNNQVDEMMRRDFEQCKLVKAAEFQERSVMFRAAARLARLMAPVQ